MFDNDISFLSERRNMSYDTNEKIMKRVQEQQRC